MKTIKGFFLIFIMTIGGVMAQQNVDAKVSLDIIKDYTIKLDGGVCSFTYDSLSLEKRDYVFVIAAPATKMAIMKVTDKVENVTLKLQGSKQQKGNSRYLHVFRGSGYEVTIDVKRTSQRINEKEVYDGTLMVKYKAESIKYKIHGIVDKYAW